MTENSTPENDLFAVENLKRFTWLYIFQEVEAEEILNVEGDEEESSDDDSDAEGFDSDADDDGISANQWGRERKGLYGAE